MSTIRENCINKDVCNGTGCFGCRIHEKFLYILSEEDVKGIYKGVSKKVTFVQTIGTDLIMDYQSLTIMKSKFAMDVIINASFTETTFDEFLANRLKPYYVLYTYVTGLIADSVNIYLPPYEIDFKSDLRITLAKKTLPKIKGIPTSAEYYESMSVEENSAVYVNRICGVLFKLEYNDYGFIKSKDAILRWYLSDGTCDEVNTKNIGHVYDPLLDSGKIIAEGVSRRRSIYNDLAMPMLAVIALIFPDKPQLEVLALGRAFMAYYNDEFNSFIYESKTVLDHESEDYGLKSIVVNVKHDTEHEWLDTVVDIGYGPLSPRQYLMQELSI